MTQTAFNLESITTGKVNRPPRVILLGSAKIGKTSFASQSPNSIFLPIKGEEGVDDIANAKFPFVENYSQVIEALNSLANSDHTYQTLVIDSASTLEPIVWAETCRRHGVETIEKVLKGFGKGYAEALSVEWRTLMSWFDYLRNVKNMGIILIGHVATKTINDPLAESYTAYLWDVQEKARLAMERWADCILFCHQKSLVKSEDVGFNKQVKRDISSGKRSLFTQARPSHPGGGRGVYGQLPYELELSWSSWTGAIANQQTQGE